MADRPDLHKRVPLALLALRLSSALVLVMWAADKLVNPQHAAHIFEKFYLLEGVSLAAVGTVGILQLVLYAGFVFGFMRGFTYTAVFAMHLVSTASSWQQYVDPWTGPHLLFFAAWPMLAALGVLLSLRDYDTLLSLDTLRVGRSDEQSRVGA